MRARAIVTAAQTLATSPDGPKIDAVHLLGAAIGAKGNWRGLNDAVTDTVYNYYSANDKVLKYLYTVAQAGSKPAGLCGVRQQVSKDQGLQRISACELALGLPQESAARLTIRPLGLGGSHRYRHAVRRLHRRCRRPT